LVPDTNSARAELLTVADEVSELLGFTPQVRLDGPIDTVVSTSVLDELMAVLREALTNVARHAHATQAIVTFAVDDANVVLEVSDDGTGIGAAERRSGLANLQSRAENRGGSLTLSPSEIEGTRLTWKIPLE
jgi:signal transduction histidine kinase